MTQESIKSILINKAEYPEEMVNDMTKFELLDHWLEWEGICGYTEEIIDTVENLFNITLED